MGLYDEKVKAILGEEAWEILWASVRSGELDALKMKETARKLHPAVGGSHLQVRGCSAWKIHSGINIFAKHRIIDININTSENILINIDIFENPLQLLFP